MKINEKHMKTIFPGYLNFKNITKKKEKVIYLLGYSIFAISITIGINKRFPIQMICSGIILGWASVAFVDIKGFIGKYSRIKGKKLYAIYIFTHIMLCLLLAGFFVIISCYSTI